jgi:hypothetical protein
MSRKAICQQSGGGITQSIPTIPLRLLFANGVVKLDELRRAEILRPGLQLTYNLS